MSRVVVVTGGGGGIGYAAAKRFVDDGETVVLIGRNEDKLRVAADRLGEHAEWQSADVGRRVAVQAAVAEIVRRHGRIDVLVNSAGFGRTFTTEMPLDEAERLWDETQDANLKGTFLMSMAAVPHLTRPGARIVNISSIGAHSGGSSPGGIAYAAAKAGVIGLTFALARELSPLRITANAIAPGYIADTGFFGEQGLPAEREQALVGQIPAGRVGHPDDVAAAVHYLASADAGYVTGQVLSVNGGWLFGR